jgi:hypothetical protein
LPGFILGTGACRKVGKGLGGNVQPYIFIANKYVCYLLRPKALLIDNVVIEKN